MDLGPPGSSVHGIFQAGILEWVPMPSSRGLPEPASPVSPALPADSLPLSQQGSLYTHIVDYYSAIKENEILPFSATWTDLEMIITSEVSQTE